jgi:hypothetical protein
MTGTIMTFVRGREIEMRTFAWLLPVGVLLLVASMAAQQPTAKPALPKPKAIVSPPFKPVASIKDIMDALVDPQSDVIFDAVATIVTKSGTEERAPGTDADWETVRKGALLLIEGGNLLMVQGRHAAGPGAKSEVPGVELEPVEIEALVKKNGGLFIRRAQGVVGAAIVALRAIEARNVQALSDAAGALDAACESCHSDFWYPNEKEQLKKVEEEQKLLFK